MPDETSREAFDTPVLLIVFNRPEQTRQVFERVRAIRPSRLYIAADGPRPSVAEDARRCEEVRAIVSAVDWPCEVRTLFREANLGCRYGPSSAITWFFDSVEEGIILEDDIVPDPSFFPFCAELLKRYRDAPEVMQISGYDFKPDGTSYDIPEDYFFASLPNPWGWASWRRAWKSYDVEMKSWPAAKAERRLRSRFPSEEVYAYWERLWDAYHDGKQSWDGQWAYACMLNGGLTAVSSVNLVVNIGFGPDATHTRSPQNAHSGMSAGKARFPLRHPESVQAHPFLDERVLLSNFRLQNSLKARLLGKLRRALGR